MDLDLDVAGIPIPWWLASQPDQVTTVTVTDDETGEAAASPSRRSSSLVAPYRPLHISAIFIAVYSTRPRP